MAFTVLKNISQDEINWQRETHYWMHISDEITIKNAGIRQGLRRGRIEGKKEQREEDAIALLQDGDSPEKISRCLKLPLEKVLELQKKIENRSI